VPFAVSLANKVGQRDSEVLETPIHQMDSRVAGIRQTHKGSEEAILGDREFI